MPRVRPSSLSWSPRGMIPFDQPEIRQACPLGRPQPLTGLRGAKQGKSITERIVDRSADRVVGEEILETR